MTQSLIKDSVNAKLDELVKKFFLGNRIFDRAMSVLDVKFVMPKTVSILHPKLAHLFPSLADKISTYQSDRNALTVYGETPLDNSDYNSPQEFFIRMVAYMAEVEFLCGEICEIAMENNDHTTKAFIDSFLVSIIPVTKQLILLADKSEKFGSDLMMFDHIVEDFIIL